MIEDLLAALRVGNHFREMLRLFQIRAGGVAFQERHQHVVVAAAFLILEDELRGFGKLEFPIVLGSFVGWLLSGFFQLLHHERHQYGDSGGERRGGRVA